MGDIYKSCERVVIWLGGEDVDSGLAKFISDIHLEARTSVPADSNGSYLNFTSVVAELLSTSYKQDLIGCASALADLSTTVVSKSMGCTGGSASG